MAKTNPRILALFDVDGTLTEPRLAIVPEMRTFIARLRREITVGVVGGSDLKKQMEQLGRDVMDCYDWNFSENGLVAYKDGVPIGRTSITDHLGEENLKRIVNWVLGYLSKVDIPIKRGTFIEFRTGMLNISPIGRNCSHAERDEFEKYDLEHKVRATMVKAMQDEFGDLGLTFSIGGQISFDLFPTGWDKTYCLRYLPEGDFDEIHFFGDKTFKGGNDYEIYTHPRIKGHSVKSFSDTMEQCTQLFFSAA
ncbi:eukaryotic phosphomannomutase [Tribonema minus]|uniref:Phosphomannomutase n=1 Tax=Tribonema minus TaxID=303371 RepID=A0A835Z1B0_9STRA|nr:eukaryotic phosphomannomutase [Tribonema minus]